MKFRIYFFICCLLFIFSSSLLVAMEKIHRIEGRVNSADGTPSVGTTVVLMKITMSRQASVVPVGNKKTDISGQVKFEVEASEEKVFYRLNVLLDDQVIGSDPMRPKGGESLVSFHIRLPETIEGVEQLNFQRNILIFDLMADAVRITEILNLENPTQNSVDIRKHPFSKSIPGNLYNFQVLEGKTGFDISLTEGKINFSLVVPPGRHQLFYSYHLPAGSDLIFNSSLPPNLKEVELIVPGNTLDVSFENTRETIVKSMKQSNNRTYSSQLLKLDSPRQMVGIHIKNLPMSQKQLFYPAIILGIILLFGLFIFLNGRNKNQS